MIANLITIAYFVVGLPFGLWVAHMLRRDIGSRETLDSLEFALVGLMFLVGVAAWPLGLVGILLIGVGKVVTR